jgi:acetyl esterase
MLMTDYAALIDGPTHTFIQDTEAAYPADTAGFSVADLRAAYDAMCLVFYHGRPAGVMTQDITIADVPCRLYRGQTSQDRRPEVIYFHGGGFYVGGLHSHDDICAEICAHTGLSVVSVDYRLSPEHLHPAAYADSLAVVRDRLDLGPVILVGDSAGGNLAAAVAHGLRGQAIMGQVLIYPGLGGTMDAGSFLTHAHAPMLTRADVVMGGTIRQNAPDDPTALPLCDTDFTNLPPTLAIAAECDPLADDSATYAAAITAAGGRAVALTEPGLVHGYLRARHRVPRATRSFARICAAITDFSNDLWPPRDLT